MPPGQLKSGVQNSSLIMQMLNPTGQIAGCYQGGECHGTYSQGGLLEICLWGGK